MEKWVEYRVHIIFDPCLYRYTYICCIFNKIHLNGKEHKIIK